MADQEGAGVDAAVGIDVREGAPDHVLAVVDDQALLRVHLAAFGHVRLLHRHDALDLAALAGAAHVVELRDVEGAPLDARQVPLHAGADDAALHVEQALFDPVHVLARGFELPGIARFSRQAGPDGGVGLQRARGHQRLGLCGHARLVHAQRLAVDAGALVDELRRVRRAGRRVDRAHHRVHRAFVVAQAAERHGLAQMQAVEAAQVVHRGAAAAVRRDQLLEGEVTALGDSGECFHRCLSEPHCGSLFQ